MALRARLDALQSQAAKAVGEFVSTREDLAQAVDDALSAKEALDTAQSANAAAQDSAGNRFRAIYMSGGRTVLLATLLRAGQPHDVLARVANISAIVTDDSVTMQVADGSRRRAQAAVDRYEKATIARARLEARADVELQEFERLIAAQEQMLAGADAEVQGLLLEQQRQDEAARQVAAAAETRRLAALTGVSSSGDLSRVYQPGGGSYACPVGPGNNFIDTWGAPRSGGRLHQGTDVFGPFGSPAYAVTDGVVQKWGSSGIGGISLWIRGVNGDTYYYAHNSQNLAKVGTVVRAGEIVALIGQSGNAAGTPPHIHFESHPGGGAAADPYPFLAAICGKG